MKKLIISTVGTSLITNVFKNITQIPQLKQIQERIEGFNNKGLNILNEIFKYSNAKEESEIEENVLEIVNGTIKILKNNINKIEFKTIKNLSAELNAILTFYYDRNSKKFKIENGKSDFHYLIETDTYFGKKSAEIVKEYLESFNISVNILSIKDLQTRELDSFMYALSDLTLNLIQIINDYKQQGWEIIFNLTGGFKGINSFMQSIGAVYADQSIYIFEKEKTLLKIPRLPVKLVGIEEIEKHLKVFRKLYLNVKLENDEIEEIKKISETLILKIGNEYLLSPWGILLFEESKKELYSKKIYEIPYGKIKLSDRFRKDIQHWVEKKNYHKEFNERIDDFIYFLIHRNKELKDKDMDSVPILRRLRFKQIKGDSVSPATHQFYLRDDIRVYLYFDNNNVILYKIDRRIPDGGRLR